MDTWLGYVHVLKAQGIYMKKWPKNAYGPHSCYTVFYLLGEEKMGVWFTAVLHDMQAASVSG